MLLFALAIAGFIGWTIWRDRDPARRRRHFTLLLGLAAAVLAAKGQWLLSGLLAAGAAWVQAQGRLARSRPSNAVPVTDLPRQLADARALLGVGNAASTEEINAAHRRLIARNHPDAGGTDALACRINAARDLLLSDTQRH